MAGLDPAIHVLAKNKKDMDAAFAEHDGGEDKRGAR
jgi:hypothetical protein